MRFKPNQKFDITAIANATVDIQYRVDDSFLQDFGFQKDIATYVDQDTADKIETTLKKPDCIISGGAAANTLCGLDALGSTCAFIGKTADDEMGQRFRADFSGKNIAFTTPTTDEIGTGRCYTFTTPDAQRTFSPFFGANAFFRPSDVDEATIKNSKAVFIEGYPMQADTGFEVLYHGAQLAKDNGSLVVFNPCDHGIIARRTEEMQQLLDITDILLCNWEEAKELTGEDDLTHMIRLLRARGISGSITLGKDGSYVFDDKDIEQIQICKAKDIIDTNGAGDQYAAGFLHGLLQGWSMRESGEKGAEMAANIIAKMGPRP